MNAEVNFQVNLSLSAPELCILAHALKPLRDSSTGASAMLDMVEEIREEISEMFSQETYRQILENANLLTGEP